MSTTFKSIKNRDAVARRLIQSGEGHNLAIPADVGDHTITYGYGYTFLRRGGSGSWFIPDLLPPDLRSIGIELSGEQQDLLGKIKLGLNSSNPAIADQSIAEFIAKWRLPPISNDQAERPLRSGTQSHG